MPLPGLTLPPSVIGGGGEVPLTSTIALAGLSSVVLPIPAGCNLVIVNVHGMSLAATWSDVTRIGDASGDAVSGYTGFGAKLRSGFAAYPSSVDFSTGAWNGGAFVSGMIILQRIDPVANVWACYKQLGTTLGAQNAYMYTGRVTLPGDLARFSITPSAAFAAGFINALYFKNAPSAYNTNCPAVGTAILTGVPATAKVIFVNWQGVLCVPRIRLGTAGGIAASGYFCQTLLLNASGGSSDYSYNSTVGWSQLGGANSYWQGFGLLTLADATNNIWAAQFYDAETSSNSYVNFFGGHVTLPGKCDRIELSNAFAANFGAAGGYFAYTALG